jgi:hypothetical protein
MKKSGNLYTTWSVKKNSINSLPTVQISQGFVALFENNYVFYVCGEDLYHRCFNSVYHVRIVSKPDIDVVFATNYCFQIIETGFAE